MLFTDELQVTLSKYNLLNHKFYQYWNEGKLNKEVLSEYAKQYYHHVEAFPKALSATHSLCESITDRKILLTNLIEEENSEPNHPELWLNFAKSLDVSKDDIDNHQINDKTKLLLDTFKSCTKSSYAEAIAAIYAHEWQYSDIAKTKKSGLMKFYDISNESDVEFFTVHSEIDIWHSAQIRDLINKLPEKDHKEAKAAAEKAAMSLWGFLDGMIEYMNIH
jgi:pyrroloquinoline-quinone synthase